MEIPKNPKFLIIQTAFLGDVVLATALVASLHKKFPDAKIDFLVRNGNQSLLQNHPLINSVLVWDKKKSKYKNLLKLIIAVRSKKYFAVVNCQRYFTMGLLTALSNGKHRIGFKQNPLSFLFTHKPKHITDQNLHEVERNLLLLAPFGQFAQMRPILSPSEADAHKVLANINPHKPFVVFAPASVWATKQLPINKWVELGKKLTHNLNIYIVGANTDADLCNRIAQLIGDGATVLAGQFSLLQTAELMRHSKMNFVNDSAPLHLASAVNAPVCAFFCSTSPSFGFGPLSEISIIAQIATPLPCKPCGLVGKPKCPLEHFDCGNKLSIDQTLTQIAQFIY